MRIAVWNLGWNRTKQQLDLMWSILRDEIRADVVLLQEAVPPAGSVAVWEPIPGRRWGSAVVGLRVDLENVTHAKGRANRQAQSLATANPGTLAVAKADNGTTALTLVSMYGLIGNGYADATVNRQLSDLVPLFDDHEHEGRIVLGGDLNITTQWTGTQSKYRVWEAATFQRIEAFGLVDCLDRFRSSGPLSGCNCAYGEDCRHIQTQRHRSSPRPWQNDYVFASARLAHDGLIRDAHVHDSDAIRDLGDHLPIVAEIG